MKIIDNKSLATNGEGMPEDRLNLNDKDWYIDYTDDKSDGYIRVKRSIQ